MAQAFESPRLTERVTLQSPATVQDANGEMIPGWSDFATVWAWIVDVTGREYVAAGATQNEALTKITIRYLAGVVPNMRAMHGDVAYNVQSVLGQDRKELTLMCKRLVEP
jgi:SPP1 family predicted phage head-tail adaptor